MSEIWQSVLNKIRGQISEMNYNSWFGGVECVKSDDDEVVLSVPSTFVKDWLVDYYRETIREELGKITGRPCDVRFEIHENPVIAEESVAESSTHGNAQQHAPLVSSMVRAPIAESLNPRYTFERFVVGTDNQFAHAASKSVADLPGGHYNPLFIYGGVGLGKTHLLNAIGMSIQERHPHLRILYIGSERFMNEVINGIRFDKMPQLRRKYRESCDVLLMDDIQFIAGKERTQDEFFHTFNCLYDAHKQIVVTSDKLPKDTPGMEDRLRSRFEWGLIADIQPPDLETRMAILHKKAEVDNITLPPEASLFLAQQIRSNVRELEGSLIRLSAYSSLNGVPITVELAKDVLKNLVREERYRCSIENVQKLVADYYQIKIADMKSQRRMKHLAFPRQIAMFLCKKHVRSSYPEIGQKFGGKDHTTVMHACRKIEAQSQTDARLRDDIAFLEKSLGD